MLIALLGVQCVWLRALVAMLSWNMCALGAGWCLRPGWAPAAAGAAQWAACRLLLGAASAWGVPGAALSSQAQSLHLGWAALLRAAGTPLAVSCLVWRRQLMLEALGARGAAAAACPRKGYQPLPSRKGHQPLPSSKDPSLPRALSGRPSSRVSKGCSAPVAATPALPSADQRAARSSQGRAEAAAEAAAAAPAPPSAPQGCAAGTAAPAASCERLVDRLQRQRAAAAQLALAAAGRTSLYRSACTHATAVAKFARPDAMGDARVAYMELAAVACRVAAGGLADTPPLQLRCVVFPGCVAVAAQVSWQGGVAAPTNPAFGAALQQLLLAEAGVQLLGAEVDGAQGEQAAAAGGCWCPSPVVQPAAAASGQQAVGVQLVLPHALCGTLADEGLNLRVVAAWPLAGGAAIAPTPAPPVLDYTTMPEELLSLRLPLPAAAGPLLTLHLLATTSGPSDAAAPPPPPPDVAAPPPGHRQERLLGTLPLLVLPSAAACGEVMDLWCAMVAQWRDAHPDEFAAEEEAKKDGVIADLAQVYLFTFTTLPWSQYV